LRLASPAGDERTILRLPPYIEYQSLLMRYLVMVFHLLLFPKSSTCRRWNTGRRDGGVVRLVTTGWCGSLPGVTTVNPYRGSAAPPMLQHAVWPRAASWSVMSASATGLRCGQMFANGTVQRSGGQQVYSAIVVVLGVERGVSVTSEHENTGEREDGIAAHWVAQHLRD
jgi:hypothetical protein